MRIFEIEKLFKSDDLNSIIKECREEIEIIDEYAEFLKCGNLDNEEAIKIALSKLTGAYMNLKTTLSIAETIKKNKELQYYIEIKEEVIKTSGEKAFKDGATQQEASYKVAELRKVRNYLEYYVDASEKGIITCQSILKQFKTEWNTVK